MYLFNFTRFECSLIFTRFECSFQGEELLKTYQDPSQADKITKIEKELEEVMHSKRVKML
jgi:hypothetical protein